MKMVIFVVCANRHMVHHYKALDLEHGMHCVQLAEEFYAGHPNPQGNHYYVEIRPVRDWSV